MIRVKGEPMEWKEGLTVHDVLAGLGFALPTMIVMLDGKPVLHQKWTETAVPDGAELAVYPMMSGG